MVYYVNWDVARKLHLQHSYSPGGSALSIQVASAQARISLGCCLRHTSSGKLLTVIGNMSLANSVVHGHTNKVGTTLPVEMCGDKAAVNSGILLEFQFI